VREVERGVKGELGVTEKKGPAGIERIMRGSRRRRLLPGRGYATVVGEKDAGKEKRGKKPVGGARKSPAVGGGDPKGRGGSTGVLASHTVRGHALPPTMPVWKGLQLVYGVGKARGERACRERGILRTTRCGERRPDQATALGEWLAQTFWVGSDRRRQEARVRSRYMGLTTTKGIRRRRGLPVRGQNTSTNGKTARKLNPGRAARVG